MPIAMSSVAIAQSTAIFPLQAIAGERFLRDARGKPFLVKGDSAWSLEVQCTRPEVLIYLDDRKARGFNTIIVEAFEHDFSSQTPVYVNSEGNAPFNSMTGINFSDVDPAYFSLLKFICVEARTRGLAVLLAFAYYGFDDHEGWQDELTADTSADLQGYGRYLATDILSIGNVILVAGGDANGGVTIYQHIVDGMRSVRTDFLLTGHARRGNDAYSLFSSLTGFNLNAQYSSPTSIVSDAATCRARPGPLPHFVIENYYEGEQSTTHLQMRQQCYQAVLSGNSGTLFGSDPIWDFGGPNGTADDVSVNGIGAAAALAGYLSSTGAQYMSIAWALFDSFDWANSDPQTDGAFVTSTIGTGSSAICTLKTKDGSAALSYLPGGGSVTLDMTKMTHASVICRWFDPTTGVYTPDSASPVANTGGHTFTVPGNNSGGDADLILRLG